MEQDHRILVEGCLQGKAQKQKELYDTFAPAMYAVALRYAHSRADADDMLQNAFIKVFRYLDKFRFECSLGYWIKRIVISESLKFLKLNWNSQVDFLEHNDFPSQATANMAIEQLNFGDLTNLLKKMPKGYRTIFQMYAIDDYSHKEIAETLNIKESTSRTQFMQARLHLQQLLKKADSKVS
jgi:RNA polymerase sigma factor (sigma-70 family)